MHTMSKVTEQEVATSKEERLRKYNHVVDSAELVSVQLIKSHFEVKPEFFSFADARKNLGYDAEFESVDYSEDRGVAMAFLRFSVDSKKGKRKLLACSASYLILYDNLTGCDRGAVEAFVRRVATFACYPYFRSHFAGLDWAATARLPPLPILREPAS